MYMVLLVRLASYFDQVWHDLKGCLCFSRFMSKQKVKESEQEPNKKLAIKAGHRKTNSFLVELLSGCFRNQCDATLEILNEKKGRAFELGYKLSYLLARFLFLVFLKEPEEVITKLVKFGASVKGLVADGQNSVMVEKITTVLKMTYKGLRDKNEPAKVKDRVIDDQFNLLIKFYGVDEVLDRFMTELRSLHAILGSPNASVALSLVEPALNHCERKLMGLQVVVETLEVYGNCIQESDNSANVQILWSAELQLSSAKLVPLEIEEEWSRLLDHLDEMDLMTAERGTEDEGR